MTMRSPEGRFDHRQLDDIIHPRIRLAVMTVLAMLPEADFTFLRDQVGSTDGNLSVQLKKLGEAGYVAVRKSFIGRRPLSTYRMTAKGRKAFGHYIERLERLIGTGAVKNP